MIHRSIDRTLILLGNVISVTDKVDMKQNFSMRSINETFLNDCMYVVRNGRHGKTCDPGRRPAVFE